MPLDWFELIGVLFGAGGIGVVLLKYGLSSFKEWRLSLAVKKHIRGLTDIASIYDNLNQLLASDKHINRAMIIRSSNSGSIPKPGCRIFIRIIHEAYRTMADSILHNHLWDERQADEQYVSLVREIAIKGKVFLRTEDLPENSALRNLYESSGTVCSTVHRLAITDTEMMYLSVNYTEENQRTPLTKTRKAQIISDFTALFNKSIK